MSSSDSPSPAGVSDQSASASPSAQDATAAPSSSREAAGATAEPAQQPDGTGDTGTDAGTEPPAENQARPNVPRIRIGSQRPGARPPAAQARPVLQAPPGSPSLASTEPPAVSAATAPPVVSAPPGEAAPSSVVAGQQAPSAQAPSAAAPPPTSKPAGKKPAGKKPAGKKPAGKEPRADVPPAPGKKVQPPNVRAALPADLEQEMAAALGDMPLDQLLSSESGAPEAAELEPETRIAGRVLSVYRDSVFVDLGGRRQGALKLISLESVPEPGTMIDVGVARFNSEDGLYELTLPGAAIAVEDWSQVSEGMVVEARVTGHNTGGLECEVNHLQGFIPASQISLYRVEDLSQFVGQKFPCVVTEVKPERRRLVLSHRAVLEREKAAAREKLLAELEPGQVREGTVRSLRDFGAFVDLGGVDGLIHISQLSWDRIKHASEVLQEGQKVKVKVQKIDPATGKISLAFRDLSESPWTGATSRYPARSKLKGTVSRITEFGAFVKLEPGIEGLVHISELSHKRVWRVEDIVHEGQEVEVLVQSVDPEQQRISLSLKALEARPTTAKKEEEQVEEEAPSPAPARKSKPLKGGIGNSSGGERFGLKW